MERVRESGLARQTGVSRPEKKTRQVQWVFNFFPFSLSLFLWDCHWKRMGEDRCPTFFSFHLFFRHEIRRCIPLLYFSLQVFLLLLLLLVRGSSWGRWNSLSCKRMALSIAIVWEGRPLRKEVAKWFNEEWWWWCIINAWWCALLLLHPHWRNIA